MIYQVIFKLFSVKWYNNTFLPDEVAVINQDISQNRPRRKTKQKSLSGLTANQMRACCNIYFPRLSYIS